MRNKILIGIPRANVQLKKIVLNRMESNGLSTDIKKTGEELLI